MNSMIDGTLAASTALRPAVSRTPSTSTTMASDFAGTDDCVCLTQQATCLDAVQRTLEPAPPLDTARIETLRQALAEGRYSINPQAIAQRMLEWERQWVR